MHFIPTSLNGNFIVESDPIFDDRGFFARTWCKKEFKNHGLNDDLVQCSISFNSNEGTLRGMHFQRSPHWEAKLVRCTRGAIFDVIIDLRPGSSTFTKWFGLDLTADNRLSLYVAEGMAHGFLTLADQTEVTYQMSEYYELGASSGVRWDDPLFAIAWPGEVIKISDRDRLFPNFIIPDSLTQDT